MSFYIHLLQCLKYQNIEVEELIAEIFITLDGCRNKSKSFFFHVKKKLKNVLLYFYYHRYHLQWNEKKKF